MYSASVSSKHKMWSFINTAALPIATHLNLVAPGASSIVHLCPFCPIFSEEDFEINEHTGGLERFYNRRYAPHPTIAADT